MRESSGVRHALTLAQVVEQFFFSHERFSYQRHLIFTAVILFSSMFSTSSIRLSCLDLTFPQSHWLPVILV